MLNDKIPFQKIFIINENNEKQGVTWKSEAILQAKEKGLDLVLISVGKSEKGELRPIARIMDYGRFKYDRKKKQKELKEKQTIIQNREIRLTINIGDHDMLVKAKKARELLLNGDRLKVSLKFRGREKSRQDLGYETLNKFVALVENISQITKPAAFTGGRFLDIYLQQDKKKTIRFLKQQKESKKEGDDDGKSENEN